MNVNTNVKPESATPIGYQAWLAKQAKEAELALSAGELIAEHTGNVTFLPYHEGDFFVIGNKGLNVGPIAGPFLSESGAALWLSHAIGISPGVFVSQFSHGQEVWQKAC